MTEWLDGLTAWLSAHPQWLGLALFVVACTECLAIIGLLMPGAVLLFTLAVLAGSGALGLGETLLLAYCGGLLGDLLSYALGRRFHQNIRRLPGLRHHPEWMASAEIHFHKYGFASLLVGRFIGPLRPMLPMVAGMLDMPFGRFLLVSLLASVGWALAYLLPGWATGAALRLPLPEGFWSEAALVAAPLGLLLGLCIHFSLQRHPRVPLLAAGLCMAALAALFVGWPQLDRLDQGLLALLQEHRHAWVDRLMVVATRLGDFKTQVAAGTLLCALLLFARQWRPALFAIGSLLGTALANGSLKWLFARVRPDVLVHPLESYSFPSGHSSAAFAFFLTLGVLAGRGQPPRLRLTWLLLACLPALVIALSRVYLGVHWPTDILAGALLAATVCAASLSLLQRHAALPALAPRVWWLVLPATLALLGGIATWALPEAMEMYRYQ
ncbi:bifunctional DedA family/phosphatase PAP2 family protein [Pseudomonas indica]|uniref:Undecaprenyl-diphosphatase n=1 Tax=Pseudomonas indica TaxID=137658 RepID=A0A1G9ATL5_9PSED|nr:bifunctional DedA family/phosphatase PAP2 family protein [Pseudomonas indica]PAU61018.1 phosphoesterase [Pseudomonas indica]SDK30652.1 undecaprenyl-diphosphatase [Pseudomonas indica]